MSILEYSFSSSDSSSTTSSSTNNDHVKVSTPKNGRAMKKHANGSRNHSKSSNIAEQQRQATASPVVSSSHRSQTAVSGTLLPKTVSCSIADLSLSTHHSKSSAASIRLPTFQSKLDNSTIESYKKIPLSQSFDWGMLAITNTDLILLYNKDKTSLVIFDANGHENEVIKREKKKISPRSFSSFD